MKKRSYAFAVAGLFSLLFWLQPWYYRQSDALQNLTLKTRDTFFKIRHASSSPSSAAQEITLITIDEESCQKLDARWPWSRTIFASLLDALSRAGAHAVALNVSFTGLENGEDSTRALTRAIQDHGNVVIGATVDGDNRLIKPNAIIAASGVRYGYLEKIVDPDLSIRRSFLLRPYTRSESSFESSFPLELAAAYFSLPRDQHAEFDAGDGLVSVGHPIRRVHVGEDGSHAINYLFSERDFSRIPAWKLVQGKVKPDALKGKIALVGLTSSLFADTHQTPLGLMSGIVIHANEFMGILLERHLRLVSDGMTYFVSWLVSLCIVALFLFGRFWPGLVGFATAVVGLFLGSQMLFAQDLIMEPFLLLSGPVLALISGIAANSAKLLWENKGLETKVIRDKMTGLYTYEYLRLRLDDEWKRCQKSKVPVAVVMTDLDRFKQINDTFGHETGNEMIRRAGAVIKESVRGYDVVSRYGGDEFVILLWHSTREEARAYRERLRAMYHAMAKKLEGALQDSSISIGIACYDPAVDSGRPADPQALVEEADKDLFADKESRRKGPPRR